MKFWKLLFSIILILGTLISISSISWLMMWMGLEINIMAFIPLMINHKNIFSSESALKYFISQTLGSLVFIFSLILNMIMFEYMIFSNLSILLINSSLMLKMGAAPFHFWFPEIIEGLNWINSFILLTWQKISPMILLMYNLKLMNFINIIIMASIMISTILSFNILSIRKIMAFSSINHSGWMLSMIIFNQSIWMIYFLIYMMINFFLICIFNFMNCFHFSQLFLILNKNKMFQILFFLNFMNLGGLPPFLGFFTKWLTLNELMNNNYFLMLIMIFFNLIMLFIYIRLMHNSFLMNNSNLKFFLKMNLKMKFIFTMNLFLLIFTPLIYNFM